MTPVVRVRRAVDADAAALARLAVELGYPVSESTLRARLAQLLPERDAVFIADRDKESVGWLHVGRRLALEAGESAEILGLVVSRSFRRGGAGRMLVAAAEDWARAQGLARLAVRSNVVRPEAHDFYPALGFERAKSQHVYLKAV